MERSYFNKELGLTRWAAWANLDWAPNAANLVAQSKNFESQRRCFGYELDPGVSWAMVDCREWTNIVAPSASEETSQHFGSRS